MGDAVPQGSLVRGKCLHPCCSLPVFILWRMEPSKGEDRGSVLFQAQYQHPESAAVCTWSYKGMRVVCFPGDAVPLTAPLSKSSAMEGVSQFMLDFGILIWRCTLWPTISQVPRHNIKGCLSGHCPSRACGMACGHCLAS